MENDNNEENKTTKQNDDQKFTIAIGFVGSYLARILQSSDSNISISAYIFYSILGIFVVDFARYLQEHGSALHLLISLGFCILFVLFVERFLENWQKLQIENEKKQKEATNDKHN